MDHARKQDEYKFKNSHVTFMLMKQFFNWIFPSII